MRRRTLLCSLAAGCCVVGGCLAADADAEPATDRPKRSVPPTTAAVTVFHDVMELLYSELERIYYTVSSMSDTRW